jgi:hypothetical protein
MPDVPQSREALETHLRDQLGFIQSSADAFDRGYEAEAKRLAVALRILLHNTKRSHALLMQLGKLDQPFLSSAFPYDELNQTTHQGLVMIAGRGRYVPHLDGSGYRRWLPFEEWWEEPILVDDRRVRISRQLLVQSVADKDGGAHVDPALTEVYHRLSRENSMGWVHTTGASSSPIRAIELASIRQIAHEALKTLVPAYEKKAPPTGGMLFGGVTITDAPAPEWLKTSRNDPCPCGSGKKFKKCHGAPWPRRPTA